MSKILMVASEANPFAKTGGLADVVGALSPTLRAGGDEVAVVMPRYRGVPLENARCVYEDLRLWLGDTSCYAARIYSAVEREVPYYFIDCPPLYDREGLYGDASGDYPDNHIRFAVFSHAALAVVRYIYRPQVLHCHDWQSALVPVYMHTRFAADPTFLGLKTLLTIHNLGYQGVFPKEALAEIGLDKSLFHPDFLEFYSKLNLLKGGILFSDALNTVSPTYAREIQTPELGFGLDGVLRARSGVLCGILNGVDYTEWSPEADRYIAANYSAEDLAGKRVCKRDLLGEFGLPQETVDRPLIGMVSRFDSGKGFDLIEEAAGELAGEDCALVALGTGNPKYEEFFQSWAASEPGKIAVRVAFDNSLAHKIEAGSDIFLMPSRYEPCGLNQIYSLRYGTVPVVRATGGLEDTVDDTTGFKFREYSAQAMLAAVRAALAEFRSQEAWTARMRRGMAKDYSWKASAAEYAALYRRLAGMNPPR
jgi:starch synthase